MTFLDFKQQMASFTVFSVKDIEKQFPGFNKMNLYHWKKKGYIEKIRNRWYMFSDFENNEYNHFLIANKIYEPSYISLESALSYYGIIPEGVFIYTSISTLKTQKIETSKGVFRYSNIKPELFFGYQLISRNSRIVKIADIEKALCDYFYLNAKIKSVEDISELRLNKSILYQRMNLKKMDQYLTIYDSIKLRQRISLLKKHMNA